MEEGAQIGDYELLRRRVVGRVTSVWRARHVVLESEHEVRILHPQWAEQEPVAAAFLAMARIQQQFRHPGLPRVTDALEHAVVVDPVDGITLRERLASEGYLAPQEAVAIATQVLQVLDKAHQAGLAHGRLDPESILLDGDRVHVTGFGEDLPGVDAPVVTVGGRMHTYLAPERVVGVAATPATDVFSVGAILWEMLAGAPPFAGSTAFTALAEAKAASPGSPDRHGEVPAWLEAVVRAALAPRQQRFHSPSAMQAALESGPRGGALPQPPEPIAGAGSARQVFLVLGSAFAAVAALSMAATGAFAYWIWTQQPPRLHAVNVQSDACGQVSIDLDVEARGRPVDVLVDGVTVQSHPPAQGRRTLKTTVHRTQGEQLTVEALVGGVRRPVQHTVQGTPPQLDFQVTGQPREGQVGVTRVPIRGTCLPPDLSWRAQVAGRPEQTGRVDALRTQGDAHVLELDTTGLPRGRHAVTVELIDGQRVVHTRSTLVLVGEAAPPDDQDLDGYRTEDDCDDADPTVNPGQPELAVPNGVDDDCDGIVDEGTAAYDDDGDGHSEEQGDCDDADPTRHPGALEVGNCNDDDCDGTIDEGTTLLQVDDTFEPNDSRDRPFDLATHGQRKFFKELPLVAASAGDEAWFRFYSQDGDFDEWGIDVTLTDLPPSSRLLVEVFDDAGLVRGSRELTKSGQRVEVRGRAFHDDSGDYLVSVRPVAMYADWCPYTVSITAR